MGGESSKNSKSKSGENPATHIPARRVNYKQVLLLHKSANANQIKTVRNFRDVLTQEGNGEVKITKNINLDKEGAIEDVLKLCWLDNANNVIVICLSPEIVNSLADVLRNKCFADQNGHINGKIVAVAFGKSMPAGWPPGGYSRSTDDKKDFCFGFEDETVISPKEFEGANFNALIATIMSMK